MRRGTSDASWTDWTATTVIGRQMRYANGRPPKWLTGQTEGGSPRAQHSKLYDIHIRSFSNSSSSRPRYALQIVIRQVPRYHPRRKLHRRLPGFG